MAKLLHLSCSPRAESESNAGASVFLDSFRKARPDWDVDIVDIWRERMPEFTGPIIEAKYARMNAQAFNEAQRDSFAEAERMAVRFALASVLLRAQQLDDAQREYGQLCILAPDYDGLIELGQSLANKEAALAYEASNS